MGIGLANPLQDIAWCVAPFVLLCKQYRTMELLPKLRCKDGRGDEVMSELKPCPFCGSEKVKAQHGVGMVMILCYKCGATVSFYEKERKEQAIEAWNRRCSESK